MEQSRRIGRPPRISGDDIVRAVLDIGLDRATITNVAQALKVSATGLRHHVKTREDLLELALHHSVVRLLEDTPQFDSLWEFCLYHARKLFDFYAAHPHGIRAVYSGFLFNTADIGAIDESSIAHGIRDGLTPAEAHEIWICVVSVVLGAATLEARDRILRSRGTTFLAQLISARGEDRGATPHLHALAKTSAIEVDHFEKVRVMLEGLRVKYGDRLS